MPASEYNPLATRMTPLPPFGGRAITIPLAAFTFGGTCCLWVKLMNPIETRPLARFVTTCGASKSFSGVASLFWLPSAT